MPCTGRSRRRTTPSCPACRPSCTPPACASNNTQLIRREVGRLVVKNAYPRPVSFYAAGAYGDFSIHRLPLAGYKAGLHIASKEIDAQAQIGQFLRTTRKMKAQWTRAAGAGQPQHGHPQPEDGPPAG